MQGARRRPYVDMVKEGNEADDCPGRNPKGRDDLGASLCREPSQYRHIASGSPPRSASHLAAVAHVPSYETGSGGAPRASAALTVLLPRQNISHSGGPTNEDPRAGTRRIAGDRPRPVAQVLPRHAGLAAGVARQAARAAHG